MSTQLFQSKVTGILSLESDKLTKTSKWKNVIIELKFSVLFPFKIPCDDTRWRLGGCGSDPPLPPKRVTKDEPFVLASFFAKSSSSLTSILWKEWVSHTCPNSWSNLELYETANQITITVSIPSPNFPPSNNEPNQAPNKFSNIVPKTTAAV
jgi:hypothetical protein